MGWGWGKVRMSCSSGRASKVEGQSSARPFLGRALMPRLLNSVSPPSSTCGRGQSKTRVGCGRPASRRCVPREHLLTYLLTHLPTYLRTYLLVLAYLGEVHEECVDARAARQPRVSGDEVVVAAVVLAHLVLQHLWRVGPWVASRGG